MTMEQNSFNPEELRQRFNPEGSPLRRQQLRMLDILTEVDRICKKNGIRYWLSSGTLIGAIRHGGFIPWDDDLDIEMLRSDYLRLMDVLPAELPDYLALQSHETDENYFYFYAKVRDRRSYLEETNSYDRHFKEKGIYIDIFPLERQRLWIHRLGELAFGHAYKIWRTSTNDEEAIKKVKRIFNINRKVVHPLLRGLNRICGAHIITSGQSSPYHNPRHENDIFPLKQHIFEGRMFPVPGNSDRVLRLIYGDYMQLPDLGNIRLHAAKMEIWE